MIELIYTGVYTQAQKSHQTTACSFLGLGVSGLNYSYAYSPQKTLAYTSCNHSLHLTPPNFTIDFSYGIHRENYVSLCHIPGLSWNPARNVIELQVRNTILDLPFLIHLTPAKLERMKAVFQRCVSLSHSPLAADVITAELLMDGVLAEFLQSAEREQKTPLPHSVKRLVEIIDQDQRFQLSLKDAMADLEVTPTHLRRLFQQFYHMTPAEYQARRRFNAIQKLMTDTDLSFKEIAQEVGMNHVTHLHAFVKKRCGLTPLQLQRNLSAQ